MAAEQPLSCSLFGREQCCRLHVAIVGDANVGKSTLFNALTGRRVAASPFPSETTGFASGRVDVADDRFERLSGLFVSEEPGVPPPRRRPLTLILIDGEETKADMLLLVLRDFQGVTRLHDEDAAQELERVCERFLEHDRKVLADAISAFDHGGGTWREEELDVLHLALDILSKGAAIRSERWSKRATEWLLRRKLFTTRPVVVALNCEMRPYLSHKGADPRVRKVALKYGIQDVLSWCGLLEARLQDQGDEEHHAYMSANPEHVSAIPRLLEAPYARLTRVYTCSEREVRCWAVAPSTTIGEFARYVHELLPRSLQVTEVLEYDDVIDSGSAASAMRQGRMRRVGSTVCVEEGQLFYFRFGVPKKDALETILTPRTIRAKEELLKANDDLSLSSEEKHELDSKLDKLMSRQQLTS